MGISHKLLRKALMPIALVMKDQRRKQPVKCSVRFSSLVKGFISESKILYGLNHKNYKHYLSDYQIMKTGAINQEAAYYLNNKVEFVEMLEGKVEMPSTLALIGKGHVIPLSNFFDDAMSLLAYLQKDESRKLVIKPIFGAEGRGVSLVQWKSGQIQINDATMTQDEFIAYLSTLDNYFISEFIQQGQFSQDLFADSLNTIRILTMVDQTSQKAFIAGSVFRVGTSMSAPTDNFRRHGLSVAVDPETGLLVVIISNQSLM